jgi:hypothetical protein
MRTLRTLSGLALVTLTIPIAAGCSNDEPDPAASGGGATATAGSRDDGGKARDDGGDKPSGDGRAQAVRFAECMRDNGVGAFPDPDASGELTVDAVANGSSIDTSGPTWTQAIAACRDLQPAGFTGRERNAAQQQAALEFAQCMRDNGVEDFPDPEPDAPIIDTNRIPSAAGRGALSIPGFTAAQDACGGKAAAAGVAAP